MLDFSRSQRRACFRPRASRHSSGCNRRTLQRPPTSRQTVPVAHAGTDNLRRKTARGKIGMGSSRPPQASRPPPRLATRPSLDRRNRDTVRRSRAAPHALGGLKDMRGPVRTDEGAQDLSSPCSLPCGNSGRRRPAAVSVAFLGAFAPRRASAEGDAQALNSGRV
jgi:hypothetical protein